MRRSMSQVGSPNVAALRGAAASGSAATADSKLLPPLFLDLDGVLADFNGGLLNLTGLDFSSWSQLGKGKMWKAIANAPAPGFFATLEWNPGGRDLWAFTIPHTPTIITGMPFGGWAEPQKRVWCARELGGVTPVITCMATEKSVRAAERLRERFGHGPASWPCDIAASHLPLRGAVLVDDTAEVARVPWERDGGVFIHHTDVRITLARLRELGYFGPVA